MNTNFIETNNKIETRYIPYLNYLKTHLSQKKSEHCISTAIYASYIAEKIVKKDLQDKAVVASIFHDLCREWDVSKMISKAKEWGIPTSKYEEKYPVLLHGPLSAYTIKQELNIKDEEILEAIYWHTTGKKELGIVGQILYVSDFCEPLRKYEQAKITRDILEEKGFEDALLFVANERFNLSLKKREPSPYSLEFLNWLKQNNEVKKTNAE